MQCVERGHQRTRLSLAAVRAETLAEVPEGEALITCKHLEPTW